MDVIAKAINQTGLTPLNQYDVVFQGKISDDLCYLISINNTTILERRKIFNHKKSGLLRSVFGSRATPIAAILLPTRLHHGAHQPCGTFRHR